MSNYTEDFNGVFVTPMADKCLNMRFFMPGCDSRDYSIVDAPATFLSPEGDSSKGTIQSVEMLESKGAFQGLVVKSIVDGVEIEQNLHFAMVSQKKQKVPKVLTLRTLW